jgi:hypothetical protein
VCAANSFASSGISLLNSSKLSTASRNGSSARYALTNFTLRICVNAAISSVSAPSAHSASRCPSRNLTIFSASFRPNAFFSAV